MSSAIDTIHTAASSVVGEFWYVVMGAIIVLAIAVMYLTYMLVKCENPPTIAKKAGPHKKPAFTSAPPGNFAMPGNRPLWHHGGGDAGNWGSMHRATTPVQAGHYMRHGGREGLIGGPGVVTPGGPIGGGATTNPCNPGETPITSVVNGQTVTSCVSGPGSAGPSWMWSGADANAKLPTGNVCGKWDSSAVAEAQALASIGGLEQDSYGEQKLQKAISGGMTLSDTQLSDIMHNGGSP